MSILREWNSSSLNGVAYSLLFDIKFCEKKVSVCKFWVWYFNAKEYYEMMVFNLLIFEWNNTLMEYGQNNKISYNITAYYYIRTIYTFKEISFW